jgi:hypothetical protein
VLFCKSAALDTLNQSGAVPDALQMIDSTVICTRDQAAGAKTNKQFREYAFSTKCLQSAA